VTKKSSPKPHTAAAVSEVDPPLVHVPAPWPKVPPHLVPSIVEPSVDAAVDRVTGEVFLDTDGTPWTKDALLTEWQRCKDALDNAKARESEYRTKVVACFSNPDKEEGAENVPLGASGWFVKVVKGMSFKLKSFVEGQSVQAAVTKALTKMASATADSQGDELNPALGAVCAARLVKWQPEMSVTEYRALLPGHREIIDTVLEIKPGAPTVTLVAPKEKTA
jgi:hypothetical protein